MSVNFFIIKQYYKYLSRIKQNLLFVYNFTLAFLHVKTLYHSVIPVIDTFSNTPEWSYRMLNCDVYVWDKSSPFVWKL